MGQIRQVPFRGPLYTVFEISNELPLTSAWGPPGKQSSINRAQYWQSEKQNWLPSG